MRTKEPTLDYFWKVLGYIRQKYPFLMEIEDTELFTAEGQRRTREITFRILSGWKNEE